MPDCFAAAVRWVWEEEEAASLVEYLLLVSLIAMVCVSAIAFLGQGVRVGLDRVTIVLRRTSP